MATTTTNNGWDIPQSSDYVKQGATAIATLGQDIDTAVGTGLLTWTNYTPTFTNLTVGNATINFSYSQLGKTVNVRGYLTFGTTTSVSGLISISLPVNTATTIGGPVIGHARYNDTGTASYSGIASVASASTVACTIANVAATYPTIINTSATIPHTWANLDVLMINLTYVAA